MTIENLYYCIVLNEGKTICDKFEQIFIGNISEQKRILEQNINKHEQFTSAQDQ